MLVFHGFFQVRGDVKGLTCEREKKREKKRNKG
jgi:hypothetical protein